MFQLAARGSLLPQTALQLMSGFRSLRDCSLESDPPPTDSGG